MPALIFNPDIPLATDRPSQSQGEILQNFTSINDIWDVNHYTFAEDDAGKHRFVQMPQQAAKPVISATEMALYTKDVGGTPQMFIERGDGTEVDFTAYGESLAQTNTSRGWTYLPSGILMKWGVTGETSIPALPFDVAIDTNVAVPGSPSFGATRFTVWILGFQAVGSLNTDSNLAYYLKSVSSAKDFTVRVFNRSGAAVPAINYHFTWLAIGPGV